MNRHSQQIFKAHRVPNSLNPRDKARVQTEQVSVFIVFKGGEACELTPLSWIPTITVQVIEETNEVGDGRKGEDRNSEGMLRAGKDNMRT